MIDRIFSVLDAVRREYAPDPRIAVFEIDVAREDSALVVFGASSVPAAVEELHSRIATLDLDIEVRDEVHRLPSPTRPFPHAIVTSAVAPMLAGPLISEPHLSQVALGNRVTILRDHGRWYQCRSEDGYLGWIHRGYVRCVSEAEARIWEVGSQATVHYSLGAELLDETGAIAARIPWGARFAVANGVGILPDGRRGELTGWFVAAAEQAVRFPADGQAIVSTARRWMGTPYLWGGTTPSGADCSGLVQTVFRTHGIELPRDSDQQARIGMELPTEPPLDLYPGDLLFFAERKDRISHVAISLGGARIIHSAVGNGGVRMNDLAADSGYETNLRTLLVTARRVLIPES